MGKHSKIRFGEYMAKVEGVAGNGNTVNFNLRREEIKHIRRCVSFYERFFARMYPNIPYDDKNLCVRIYSKFGEFGKLKSGLRPNQKTNLIQHKLKKCSHPNCSESECLTIDHIKRASSMSKEEGNVEENLQLLCPKHHLLKELDKILWHKKLEIEKLKARMKQIEEQNTTDVLGYQVLGKDKFRKMDLDIGEEEIEDNENNHKGGQNESNQSS